MTEFPVLTLGSSRKGALKALSGLVPTEELVGEHSAAVLIDQANPAQIAAAILRLQQDPLLRHSVAEAGYREYIQHSSLGRFSERLSEILTWLPSGRGT